MTINVLDFSTAELVDKIRAGDKTFIQALKDHFLQFLQNMGRPDFYIHEEAVNELIALNHLTQKQIFYVQATKISQALKMLFNPEQHASGHYKSPPFRWTDVKGLMDYYGCELKVKEDSSESSKNMMINFVPLKVIPNKDN